MITIICGEDSSASRDYYTGILEDLAQKDYQVMNVTPQELEEHTRDEAAEVSLFGNRLAYGVAGLNTYIKKNTASPLISRLSKLEKSKEIQIVDWEDGVQGRGLKLTIGIIKEFKPAQNIFKLLDGLYPSNLKMAISMLREVSAREAPIFVLTMISRHARKLLISAEGATIAGLASWQAGKLHGQARHWDKKKLLSFYQALIRLDIAVKTSTNPLDPMKTLEVIFCYHLG